MYLMCFLNAQHLLWFAGSKNKLKNATAFKAVRTERRRKRSKRAINEKWVLLFYEKLISTPLLAWPQTSN